MTTKISHYIKNINLYFYLLLLTCMAGMLMIEYKKYISIFLQLNIVYVGCYLITRILQITQYLSRFLHIAIICTLLAIDVMHFDSPILIGVNILIFSCYLLTLLFLKDYITFKTMCYTAAFPFAFTLLDMMAISKFDLNEFASNAWYAFFIVIGVWVMARNNLINLTKYAPKFVCALLFIYTLILTQIPLKTSSIVAPIQMYGINIIDARNLNSYNLAIYSAFALIVGIYFFVKSSNFLRFLLIGAVLILSNFILMTSWRPVWLALGLSALFIFVIIDRQKWFNLVIGMLAIQAILLASNFVNYGNRIYEIAKNINTEERLTIWKDAWRMQLTSQPREWLTGHGLNSFYSDFKAYSTYHSIHNFRSPHNVFLDLIYTSGMLGLVTVLCFYYFTYKYIFKALKFSKNNNILICTLLILLTTNLIFNGLNHAFFMRLNIFPIAFICAMLLYLKEHQWQSNTDYV